MILLKSKKSVTEVAKANLAPVVGEVSAISLNEVTEADIENLDDSNVKYISGDAKTYKISLPKSSKQAGSHLYLPVETMKQVSGECWAITTKITSEYMKNVATYTPSQICSKMGLTMAQGATNAQVVSAYKNIYGITARSVTGSILPSTIISNIDKGIPLNISWWEEQGRLRI